MLIAIELLFKRRLLCEDGVYLIVQILYHYLGLEVDLVVVLGTAAVLLLLTVLAHHDKRCLDGGNARQHEVEHDKRVRVERFCRQHGVDDHPQYQNAGECEDERPASCEFRNSVGGTTATVYVPVENELYYSKKTLAFIKGGCLITITADLDEPELIKIAESVKISEN